MTSNETEGVDSAQEQEGKKARRWVIEVIFGNLFSAIGSYGCDGPVGDGCGAGAADPAVPDTPRKYGYALWAVVGFRLVCPVTLFLPVSIYKPAFPTACGGTGRIHWQRRFFRSNAGDVVRGCGAACGQYRAPVPGCRRGRRPGGCHTGGGAVGA